MRWPRSSYCLTCALTANRAATHITYLASMTAKRGPEDRPRAIERYQVLKKEFDAVKPWRSGAWIKFTNGVRRRSNLAKGGTPGRPLFKPDTATECCKSPDMKRRTFLQLSIPLAAGLALPACKRIEGSVEKPLLPLVLKGGRSFFEGRWQIMDIGIDAAGKLRFGIELRGAETLNVMVESARRMHEILADNSTSPKILIRFSEVQVSDGVLLRSSAWRQRRRGAYYRRLANSPIRQLRVLAFVMAIRARTGGSGL